MCRMRVGAVVVEVEMNPGEQCVMTLQTEQGDRGNNGTNTGCTQSHTVSWL